MAGAHAGPCSGRQIDRIKGVFTLGRRVLPYFVAKGEFCLTKFSNSHRIEFCLRRNWMCLQK